MEAGEQVMPMKFVLSGAYGELSEVRGGDPHTGIDIPMEVGTRLRAFVDGTVERIVDYGNQNLGKGVIIRGQDGNHYIYGHLSKVTARVGEHVHPGNEIIGLSGNTGNSTAPHLHFGIQAPDGHFIDPTPAVKALESVTGPDPLNHFIGSQPLPGTFMDWVNHFGDKVESKVDHPIISWIGHQISSFWHDFFVPNLPDVMGYATLAAGALIILSSMTSHGILKPIAVYTGLLITSVCILSGKGG